MGYNSVVADIIGLSSFV